MRVSFNFSGLFHHRRPKHNLDKQGQNLDFIKMRNELQMNIQGNLLSCFFLFCSWCVCESNKLEKWVAGGAECRQSWTWAGLTIFTDVPFSPAGGCLLLPFLTRHGMLEGQQEPMDTEKTHRTERCYQQPTLAGLQKSFSPSTNRQIYLFAVIISYSSVWYTLVVIWRNKGLHHVYIYRKRMIEVKLDEEHRQKLLAGDANVWSPPTHLLHRRDMMEMSGQVCRTTDKP